jgi:protein-tyrosine phosphatase
MTLITSHLALGNARDPFLFAKDLDAVLCCAAEIPLYPGKPGCHLRLQDGVPVEAPLLEQAFAFLDEQLRENRFTLVYCGYGTSRSVSILCGYLALRQKISPSQVLTNIRRLRPEANPARVLFQSVERYVLAALTPAPERTV